jgi:hypothetical protein
MYCSKCKLAVVELSNKKLVKACTCDAPIAADMEATVKQTSTFA